MKKIAAIILLPLIIINCCNDNKDIPDYRDKYIGDYQCNRTGGYFCGDIVSYYNDTTLIIAITFQRNYAELRQRMGSAGASQRAAQAVIKFVSA